MCKCSENTWLMCHWTDVGISCNLWQPASKTATLCMCVCGVFACMLLHSSPKKVVKLPWPPGHPPRIHPLTRTDSWSLINDRNSNQLPTKLHTPNGTSIYILNLNDLNPKPPAYLHNPPLPLDLHRKPRKH